MPCPAPFSKSRMRCCCAPFLSTREGTTIPDQELLSWTLQGGKCSQGLNQPLECQMGLELPEVWRSLVLEDQRLQSHGFIAVSVPALSQ